MKRLYFFLTIILFNSFTNLYSADKNFFIKETRASWIEDISFDKDTKNTSIGDDGGSYYLLDYQNRVESQETYAHLVIKINNEKGIQNYSDIWIV